MKEAWMDSGWWSTIKKLRGSTSFDILDLLGKKLKNPDFERFCTKMWGVCVPLSTALRSMQTWRNPHGWVSGRIDFQKAQKHNSPYGGSLVTRYTQVQDGNINAPYTIYVDAAYNDGKLDFATAFAIFDPGRRIWAAGFRQIQAPGTVMATEL